MLTEGSAAQPTVTSAPAGSLSPISHPLATDGLGKGSDGHADVMRLERCSCPQGVWPHLPSCRLGSEELAAA